MVLAFVVGLFFMLLYYRLFHTSKISSAFQRSSEPTENGSSGTNGQNRNGKSQNISEKVCNLHVGSEGSPIGILIGIIDEFREKNLQFLFHSLESASRINSLNFKKNSDCTRQIALEFILSSSRIPLPSASLTKF